MPDAETSSGFHTSTTMRALLCALLSVAAIAGTIHKHPHDALRAAGVDSKDFKLFRPRKHKDSVQQSEHDHDRVAAASNMHERARKLRMGIEDPEDDSALKRKDNSTSAPPVDRHALSPPVLGSLYDGLHRSGTRRTVKKHFA